MPPNNIDGQDASAGDLCVEINLSHDGLGLTRRTLPVRLCLQFGNYIVDCIFG
jgi:hypothetical protein